MGDDSSNGKPAASAGAGLSFSFTSKSSKSSRAAAKPARKSTAFTSSHGQSHEEEEDATTASTKEFVTTVAAGEVQGSAPSKVATRVIPLSTNPWTSSQQQQQQQQQSQQQQQQQQAGSGVTDGLVVKKELTLDEQAAAELAQEATEAHAANKRYTGDASDNMGMNSSRVIKLKTNDDDTNDKDSSINGNKTTNTSSTKRRGLLEAAMIPGLKDIDGDIAKLKHDLSVRADDIDANSDVYRSVPVNEFGAALLRGMGWSGHDNNTSDKNSNRLSSTIESRPGRLGLGAQAKPIEEMLDANGNKKKRVLKPGEKPRKQDQEINAQWDAKLKAAKNQSSANSGNNNNNTISVGDVITIQDTTSSSSSVSNKQQQQQQRAMVLATQGVPGLGKIRVKLEGDGTDVIINKTDAIKVHEDILALEPFSIKNQQSDEKRDKSHKKAAKKEHKKDKKRDKHSKRHDNGRVDMAEVTKHYDKKRNHDNSDQHHHNSNITDDGNANKRHKTSHNDVHDNDVNNNDKEPYTNRNSCWLCQRIRVRLVGKAYKRGEHCKHYCKKGVVTSVQSNDKTCSIRMDTDDVLQCIHQNDLETVVPSINGSVTIVKRSSTYYGRTGVLIAKGSSSSKSSTTTTHHPELKEGMALIRIEDNTDTVITLSLDDIAEAT